MPHWVQDAIFYHIYPLGFCGAPTHNDRQSPPVPRLHQLFDWIDHWEALGVNTLYLGPVFESSAHGYDTADYFHVDRRLGSDGLLKELSAAIHARGFRLILDGVFHHVGRDFWAFRDVQQKGAASSYRTWFSGLEFGRTSSYGDPFTYHAWNGCYDLVKLELSNSMVRQHLFQAIDYWIETFGIDGLRLDAADSLDPAFLRALAAFCRSRRPDFYLLGEVIHGDYRRVAGPGLSDAATNYEGYKGLFSSHNDRNYFEIAASLRREFGPGGLYAGMPLYNFADNHDVDRIASTLREPAHLYPLHLLLFTMPGVPSIYYGSEWGMAGRKTRDSQTPLRPPMPGRNNLSARPHPDLAGVIGRLARVRHETEALRYGDYQELLVKSEQLAFARRTGGQLAVVVANQAAQAVSLELSIPGLGDGRLVDRLNPGDSFTVRGGRVRIDPVHSCWGRVLVAEG